jgi:hypothetical protein
MGSNVFANNQEVSCKGGAGKSICAFPDVCWTPPQTLATPNGVPVPYPNTGMDSDASDGSSSVQIGGQEVMLKNKSYFKQSTGDEAGAAPMKGLVSMVNQGKVYFIAWSMDVKVEGENVVRNFDMTTHNHASPVANSPPQIFMARMEMANIPGCEGETAKVKEACGDNGEKFTCPDDKPHKDAKKARQAMKDPITKAKLPGYDAAHAKVISEVDNMVAAHKADDCRKKMHCVLSPYKKPDNCCCPGQTAHHLVEANAFYDFGRSPGTEKKDVKVFQTMFVKSFNQPTAVEAVQTGTEDITNNPIEGAEGYREGDAPCVCAEGENQHEGTHMLMHQSQGQMASDAPGVVPLNYMKPLFTSDGAPAKMQRLQTAIDNGANSVKEVFSESNCDVSCLKAQLEEYHFTKAGIGRQFVVKACGDDGKALPA